MMMHMRRLSHTMRLSITLRKMRNTLGCGSSSQSLHTKAHSPSLMLHTRDQGSMSWSIGKLVKVHMNHFIWLQLMIQSLVLFMQRRMGCWKKIVSGISAGLPIRRRSASVSSTKLSSNQSALDWCTSMASLFLRIMTRQWILT